MILCIINSISIVILFSLFTGKQKQIIFDRDAKIVSCDGIKLISLREGSANFRFIEYIFENKNKEISLSELENGILFGNDLNLSKVISNTNLPKDIIKKAFNVKGDVLIFNDKI